MEDEINKVKEQLKVLEDRERTEGSSKELDSRIAIKEQRLLVLEQQGKFHHIFSLPFPNLLDVILCPNRFRHLLFTHSGSATTKGMRL